MASTTKVAVILALLSWTTWSTGQTVSYVEGMRVGQGYDLLRGREKNNDCIKPTDEAKETPYDSLSSDFQFEEIRNTESMRRFLQVDAAAAYNAAGNGGGVKVNFMNSVETASSHSTFSFRHLVKAGEITSNHFEYDAATARMKRDPVAFRNNCGTHYIKAIVTGGEFYGKIVQEVSSETEKNEFRTAANAAMNGFQADFSTKSQLETSRFASTLRGRGYKAGGAAELVFDIPQMRTELLAFRKEVEANKRFNIAVVLGENPSPPVDAKSTALEESANLLLRYVDAEKQLEAIETKPSAYFVDESISPETSATIRALLRKQKNLVVSIMDKCKASSTKNAAAACDLSRFALAYPPPVNTLAKFYQSNCSATLTPAPLVDGVFVGLPRVAGDDSMGGQDVAAATITYMGTKDGFINRNIKLRIVETKFGNTAYAKEADSVAWSESVDPGCSLGADLSLPPDDSGAAFPHGEDTPANDYIALQYPTAAKYLSSATCRSNQPGADDGYVGCTRFEFKPIQVNLRHVELRKGPPPVLTVPDWLARPTKSKAYVRTLRVP